MLGLFSSALTAMIKSPRSAKRLCNSSMTGKDCLHGPHQEAQKSTRTTLAFVVSGRLPSSLNSERAGKESPGLSSPAVAVKEVKSVKKVKRLKTLKRHGGRSEFLCARVF